MHPVEDDFPGHNESVRHMHDARGATTTTTATTTGTLADEFYSPEDEAIPRHVKIDKSNMLLIGPTGVGKTYILE